MCVSAESFTQRFKQTLVSEARRKRLKRELRIAIKQLIVSVCLVQSIRQEDNFRHGEKAGCKLWISSTIYSKHSIQKRHTS